MTVADDGSIIGGRSYENLSVVIQFTMILLWALYYKVQYYYSCPFICFVLFYFLFLFCFVYVK